MGKSWASQTPPGRCSWSSTVSEGYKEGGESSFTQKGG